MPVLRALRCMLAIALVAGGLTLMSPALASAPAARAGKYVPPAGPNFNNPLGTTAQQRKLLRQVIRTTNAAPSGATIRMAVFSFGDGDVADALIAAHRRGVNVKLVFAGENVYPAMKRLRTALGTDNSARSFVVICQNSCRGERGQMHAKYFSFTRSGAARWVTMVGSVNLTKNNAQNQWNDLYTRVDDREYFLAFRGWFGQLKRDRPVERPYVQKATAVNGIRFTPVDLKVDTDPILDILDRVRCQVTAGEIDPESPNPDEVVPTSLYINTHAWNQERGKTIAWRVVGLRAAGCDVRVFYGTGMGGAVRAILTNNGVEMNNGQHKKIRTHQKVMMVDGAFGDDLDTVRAWTGSQNWSNRATNRDDLIVQLNDAAEAQEYVDRFLWMWERG